MNTTADGYGNMTHPTLRARAFDNDKALRHFANAGFTRRGPDGVLVNDAGVRLSF
jgi:microcin C transport system substrate-binding protein